MGENFERFFVGNTDAIRRVPVLAMGSFNLR